MGHWLLQGEPTERNGNPFSQARMDKGSMMEGPFIGPASKTVNHSETLLDKREETNYFLLRYETLVKDPTGVVLKLLEWAKPAVVLSGATSASLDRRVPGTTAPEAIATQSALLDRAKRCTNYGNVVGRIAKTHRTQPGLGTRFRVGNWVAGAQASLPSSIAKEQDQNAPKQLMARRIVFDHTQPYFCALGNTPPREISC